MGGSATSSIHQVDIYVIEELHVSVEHETHVMYFAMVFQPYVPLKLLVKLVIWGVGLSKDKFFEIIPNFQSK